MNDVTFFALFVAACFYAPTAYDMIASRIRYEIKRRF